MVDAGEEEGRDGAVRDGDVLHHQNYVVFLPAKQRQRQSRRHSNIASIGKPVTLPLFPFRSVGEMSSPKVVK